LTTECDAHYPNLQSDLKALRENPGLLTFILDNLVDVETVNRTAPQPKIIDEDEEDGWDVLVEDTTSLTPMMTRTDHEMEKGHATERDTETLPLVAVPELESETPLQHPKTT